MQISCNLKAPVMLLAVFLALIILSGPSAAQQSHDWSEIILPPGVWAGLDADLLHGLSLDEILVQDKSCDIQGECQQLCIGSECRLGWTWSLSGSDIYYDTGNIGIGTTGPDNKLHIVDFITNGQILLEGCNSFTDNCGSSSGEIILGNGETYDGRIAYDGFGGDLYIANSYNIDSGDIYFQTKTSGTAVDALTILGSGNVGIGTTGPTFKVHIKETLNNNLQLAVENPSTGPNAGAGIYIRNDAGDYVLLRSYGSGQTGNTFGLSLAETTALISSSSGSGLLIGSQDATPIVFGTSNLERMRITDNGNVGIGTAAPGGRLEINGNGGSSVGLKIASLGTATHGINMENSGLSGSDKFLALGSNDFWLASGDLRASGYIETKDELWATADSRIGGGLIVGSQATDPPAGTLLVTGNVGIGTNNPGAKLDVNGDAYFGTYDRIQILGNDGRIDYFGMGGTPLQIRTINSNYDIELTPSGTGDVLITNGNVGIGTTNPQQRLDVNGKIRMRDETQPSDSDNTVATKGYVDAGASCSCGACWSAQTQTCNPPQCDSCYDTRRLCTPAGWVITGYMDLQEGFCP